MMLRIDKVTDMSLVYYYFGTHCRKQNASPPR